MHPSFALVSASQSRPSAAPVSVSLSVRIDDSNPDHHLWRNRGTWWIHYTEHRGSRKHRCRHSLHTKDLIEARQRRDVFFRSRGIALANSVAAASRSAADLALSLERWSSVAGELNSSLRAQPHQTPHQPRAVSARRTSPAATTSQVCFAQEGVA